MRRGVDAVDVESLLLRNSEARQAQVRATEESRRAAGFIVGSRLVQSYDEGGLTAVRALAESLTIKE